MKKRYIPLVVLGTIVGAVVAFAGVDFIVNTCHLPNEETYTNLNWMENIKDDSKLSDIVMPGSHDAGSYDMIFLGETQHKDVANQLKAGARYFDLRVRKNKNGEYIIYHDIINGVKFEKVWKDITDFITQNPTETLILDFQHFDNAEEYVCSLLDENKSLLISNDTDKSDLEFVDSLTLGECRGKMLALFGDGADMDFPRNYIFARNSDYCTKYGCVLDSYYDDDYKKTSKYLIDNVLPENYNRIEEKIKDEGFKGLFVLQCQLTDGKLIFGPYSREVTHYKNIAEYIKNIKDDPRRLGLTNIIMRDFLTDSKTSAIIELNTYKNLVKTN